MPSVVGSWKRILWFKYLLPTVHSLLAITTAAPQPAKAVDEPSAPPPGIELSNANTVALLAGAREALFKLDNPPAGDGPGQPKIYFDTAVDGLTTLDQLHGCQWAAPELRKLYARPDAPPLRLGFSPDGRVLLRIEPLVLKNPAFDNYTVLLCTFGSQTGHGVTDPPGGTLELALPAGTTLRADEVTEAHPLWEQLRHAAGQYGPPEFLPSGGGLAWKQLYSLPLARLPLNHCTLSLDWGGYHFDLPRWVDATTGASDG